MSGPVESRRGTNSPGLLPSPSPQTGASEATIPYCPPRTMTKTTRRSKLSHHLSVPAEFGTPELVSTRRASADAISPLSLSASKLQRTGSERMWQDIRMGPELSIPMTPRSRFCKSISRTNSTIAKAKARNALKINDAMVYLEGPQVYACAQCRTHLTSHDDIISKSFHGRHGRAYLFDQCVNITLGPAEDRNLMTGLHSVSDIFCKRCKNMVGWTYAKAYESSQKYKEGKYIIEKINLHLEESGRFDVAVPAGERVDRWRQRSLSWGDRRDEVEVFEYDGSPQSPTFWRHSSSDGASWGSGSSSCGLGMIASPLGIPSAPVL